MRKKILILCPLQDDKGGVANYYRILKDNFKADDIKTAYYFSGKRFDDPCLISRVAYSCKDILVLLFKFNHYDLIHLNPSLDPKGIIRDGFYHYMAKRLFKKKTIVFFRGWSIKTERIINERFSSFFKTIFNFNCSIVLANEFKSTLIRWGYDSNIIRVETTTVDEYLLKGFSIKDRLKNINSQKIIQILFLARIEKEKGINETIDAFKELSERHKNIRLVIAGVGSFEDKAKRYVNKLSLKNVSFVGYVRNDEKRDAFLNSDIYVFPTYDMEGMPNSVLEAMAMGLPVVTTPVGGLKDFFKNGEHGFLLQSKDPKEIATSIEKVITDKVKWCTMAKAAHEYAVERFLSSKVAQRLENIYREVSGL